MVYEKDNLMITDDKTVIDYDYVIHSLHTTYWAQEREGELIRKSIENSLFLLVFINNDQIGFSRVVTDYAIFAWIADVYIDEAHRKKGIGKKLVELTLAHPEIRDLHLKILKTKDAHKLYEKFGFKIDNCMTIRQ